MVNVLYLLMSPNFNLHSYTFFTFFFNTSVHSAKKKLYLWVGLQEDNERELYPPYRTPILFFCCIGFGTKKVTPRYYIIYVDSMTNVSFFDTQGQFRYLPLNKSHFDKENPTKPLFLSSIQCPFLLNFHHFLGKSLLFFLAIQHFVT